MGDALKQRKIVVRIAVAAALAEVAHAAALRGQPFLEAADLALAKARRAGHAAGELPVARLGLRGDEMANPEFARDRRGHEAVRRGDDGAKVVALEVLAH